MGSEVLLYGYGIVCLCMLAFNLVYGIVLRQGDRRLDKRVRILSENVKLQLRRVREGKEIGEGHLRFLEQRLSFVGNLIAFDRVMEDYLPDKSDPAAKQYIRCMQPVILRLAALYGERESMQTAYFAYFLSKHRIHTCLSAGEELTELLAGYMKKESLYCHVNALQALCDIGSASGILKAMKLLDRRGSDIHEKILTDGLLTFSGSHEELIALLWDNFEHFSNKMKLSVLNYIRFKSGDYCERMLTILTSDTAEKELRLCAIRYFGRYAYEPALEALLAFAVDRDPLDWEYTATAVTSLANYQGEAVIEALTQAVHSANWYVRYNAASSLEAHHLDYSDLIEVVGGSDRYAREMMMYRLDFKRMEQGDWEEELI
ncbi:MAG: HEAT repeat domain-containing protein [Lachnospiraceae bacterium]|nr:HEAT repeat domain-containing protein [Lachnospiraceae bacterium]